MSALLLLLFLTSPDAQLTPNVFATLRLLLVAFLQQIKFAKISESDRLLKDRLWGADGLFL